MASKAVSGAVDAFTAERKQERLDAANQAKNPDAAPWSLNNAAWRAQQLGAHATNFGESVLHFLPKVLLDRAASTSGSMAAVNQQLAENGGDWTNVDMREVANIPLSSTAAALSLLPFGGGAGSAGAAQGARTAAGVRSLGPITASLTRARNLLPGASTVIPKAINTAAKWQVGALAPAVTELAENITKRKPAPAAEMASAPEVSPEQSAPALDLRELADILPLALSAMGGGQNATPPSSPAGPTAIEQFLQNMAATRQYFA